MLVNDKPIKACLVLAVEMEGKSIITVEGLIDTEIQQTFVDHSGFQCGYCTAGFLVNSYALLETIPNANANDKVEWLSSNLCRCTGYEGIELAINVAQELIKKRKEKL